MKHKKYFVGVIAIVYIFSMLLIFANATEMSSALLDERQAITDLISEYVEYLDEGAFSNAVSLWCEEEQPELQSYLSNNQNAESYSGMFNYKSAELVSINLSDVSYHALGYGAKTEMYEEISCWDCIINVTTYTDSDYLSNGNNRFWFVIGKNSRNCLQIIGVARDRTYNAIENNVVLPFYDVPVAPSGIGAWQTPSTIRVLVNGSIEVVNFKEYCYVVTVNEVGTDSYNQTARTAVALAIKNYGWNRTLVQKYPYGEYDVTATENDQVYNTNKPVTTNVRNAVNTIWNYVMLSCDYKLFCAFYYANSTGAGSGILSQNESEYLANNGYSWQSILHYFYDYGQYNAYMTQGVIRIVNLNHAASGSYNASNADLYSHWRNCSTCGCIHTLETHTWVYHSTFYRCSVCGYTATSVPSINSIR